MIYFASDHGGYTLKDRLFVKLSNQGYDTYDLGCTGSQVKCDYPLFADRVANHVTDGDPSNTFGVLICGTGIGVSMAANRHRGIRAALCHNLTYAKLAREHNNANVLCLPGRFIQFEDAYAILMCFLSTQFSTEKRHTRRLELFDEII